MCGRQDTSQAAEPRAKLSRRALRWALEGIVCQHLTVARVAEDLGVSWNTANDAVLAEGRRVLIEDPHRFDGVRVIGVDERCWRHTRRGDKYVTVIIDLTPIRDGTGNPHSNTRADPHPATQPNPDPHANSQPENTVTVTDPGNQTGAIGTPVSLQIQATDSAPGQTLTFTATGLPQGLTINSSTGLISGTPTKRGNSTVTVTATDTTNASGSATFTWTIRKP